MPCTPCRLKSAEASVRTAGAPTRRHSGDGNADRPPRPGRSPASAGASAKLIPGADGEQNLCRDRTLAPASSSSAAPLGVKVDRSTYHQDTPRASADRSCRGRRVDDVSGDADLARHHAEIWSRHRRRSRLVPVAKNSRWRFAAATRSRVPPSFGPTSPPGRRPTDLDQAPLLLSPKRH